MPFKPHCGPKRPSYHRHPKPWGLRRRLTITFAFVALAAVALTTWLTLGAVLSAQQALFWESTNRNHSFGPEGFNPNDPSLLAAKEAFQKVTRTAFWAGLLAFFLASAVATAVTRVLTRPLLALTDGAKRLEAGERNIKLPLPKAQDELRSLTEAFNNLVSGLERQEAFRRDMVADIAHDLRTPLAVMQSEIEAMQDGLVALDEQGLSRLHGEVLMLAGLVEDLKTLTLAESGGLKLDKVATDTKALLGHIVDLFKSKAAETGRALEDKSQAGIPIEVDFKQMIRVLSNVVDNALRYGEGPIELGALEDESGTKLWVRDHGSGLSKEAMKQVFERFYRGDSSRTHRREGSGLGLAIAKAITEAHGGNIEARNHPEGGAEFLIYLKSISLE